MIVDSKKAPNALLDLLISLALLAGGLAFAWHMVGPATYTDFVVLRDTSRTAGNLLDAVEVEREDETGNIRNLGIGVYRFHVGTHAYLCVSNQKSNELPRIITVEYATTNPTVNRQAGTGAQTMREWLWSKFALGLVLLGFCLAPGIGALLDLAKRRHDWSWGGA